MEQYQQSKPRPQETQDVSERVNSLIDCVDEVKMESARKMARIDLAKEELVATASERFAMLNKSGYLERLLDNFQLSRYDFWAVIDYTPKDANKYDKRYQKTVQVENSTRNLRISIAYGEYSYYDIQKDPDLDLIESLEFRIDKTKGFSKSKVTAAYSHCEKLSDIAKKKGFFEYVKIGLIDILEDIPPIGFFLSSPRKRTKTFSIEDMLRKTGDEKLHYRVIDEITNIQRYIEDSVRVFLERKKAEARKLEEKAEKIELLQSKLNGLK